jgi:hypothetical protein
MKFQIVDLVSKKVLTTVDNKGEADREFVRLQNEHPKRRLWLKMK